LRSGGFALSLAGMHTIADIKNLPRDDKQSFETVVILRKATVKRAKNDSEFLMTELGDKTGVMHYVCFANSKLFGFFLKAKEGTVLRVQGQTDYYQNRLSPAISNIEQVHETELGRYMEQLIETAPMPAGEMWQELQGCIGRIQHAALQETVRSALKELERDFQTIPGAISMHHAYRSGLMEHTLRMCRACASLLPLYPEVCGDLALAGTILHDLGKALEYTNGLATAKSRLGHLHGHVVLGYRQARRAGIKAGLDEDTLDRLEHIILSHQGELEWGAAVKAATPEAVFVSMIDNLDAKMGMVQYTLRTTPDSEDFSEYIPGLGAPLLVRRPKIAPPY
jgi:3'-5' exoribonuclease